MPGVAGFGFTIAGGDDVDGLQPHIDVIDPYGPAAAAGLQVGDMVISVNGQSYKHAGYNKVRSAIKAAEASGQVSLSMYRDFGTPRTAAPAVRGFDSMPRRLAERPRAADAEHISSMRRNGSQAGTPSPQGRPLPTRSPFAPL